MSLNIDKSCIEAVVLTGGASRRMGHDKASLLADDLKVSQKIAIQLSEASKKVTVLGQHPIEGFEFLRDQEQYGGPLAALARFHPSLPYVFVASCDMPHFSQEVVHTLSAVIEDAEAAIPSLAGRLQPLCAIYVASAMLKAHAARSGGERRIMTWVELLRVNVLDFDGSPLAKQVQSANTPEEWSRLVGPS